MAINRTSPKKGKVVDIPDAPTIGTATAGAVSATVAFTAATKGGPATTYTALSNPDSITGTSSSSPITVSGLTFGTTYTFTVRGNNATGSGEYSSASNSIVPLENTAYESIATISLTSNAQSVTFSSIPQTYKHLELRYISRDTYPNSTPGLQFLFNGGAFTSTHSLLADGGSVYPSSSGGGSKYYLGFSIGNNLESDIYAPGILKINDYSSTVKNKTFSNSIGAEFNSSGGYTGRWDGTLSSTSPITSITLQEGDLNFKLMAGSHYALYGIKGV